MKKKDNIKPASPLTKLIMCNNVIIKVQEETPDNYIGFDVFTECLYCVKKTPKAIELPEAIITLLGCEKSRFQLANVLGIKPITVAKILNVNERTVFRMYNEYDIFDDRKLAINKKISESRLKKDPKKQLV
jgi:hypothetical protein